MGDCLSRPNTRQVSEHKAKENRKNDGFFLGSSLAQLKPLDTLSTNELENIIVDLEKEQKKFNKRLESSTAGEVLVPKLCIEIQKGVDLFIPGCCNNFHPFIRVKLEPLGPTFDTLISDKYLPRWYEAIPINQSLDGFSTIRLTVMFENDKKNEYQLGFYEFDLDELEDQKIKEGWFDLNVFKKDSQLNPKLRLRIQLVTDERALLVNLIRDSNDKIEAIQELIVKNSG